MSRLPGEFHLFVLTTCFLSIILSPGEKSTFLWHGPENFSCPKIQEMLRSCPAFYHMGTGIPSKDKVVRA